MSKLRRFLRDIRQLARSLRSDAPDISYDELRRREELYRLLADHARDIIWLLEFPNRTTYVSPASKEILGWDPAEQVHRAGGVQMLTDESAARARRLLVDAVARRAPSLTFEAEHRRADGTTIWCEVHQGIVYDDDGHAVSCVGITRDISEQKRLRDQLALAQKKEAIGAIAGGVAHDFNNFLTVIIGSLDLVKEELGRDAPTAQMLGDALDAAERAAAITAQLLGFSRHQPLSIEPLDINALLSRSEPLMRGLLGERIRFESNLLRGLAVARADENQIQQIVLNLLMNARDAIEDNGSITLETRNALIDSDPAEDRPGVAAGSYAVIAVSDDGTGMDPETLLRATEPFFSTKGKGSGTGLGLAMVKSMLEQMGGDLAIESEPEIGTRVTAYIPVATDMSTARLQENEPIDLSESLRGSESIVVVEDEEAVRTVTCRVLLQAGYSTYDAATPSAALEKIEELTRAGQPPDLVLTDLVMPEMSGADLAALIESRHPAIPIVIMSGYAEAPAKGTTKPPLPGPLVTKPFHPNELLRAIRASLEKPTP